MSNAINLSLKERVLLVLEKTLSLGVVMLLDLVRRAYDYAKVYTVTLTFSLLCALTEALANA